MVRQGHFASTTRTKQSKTQRYKNISGQGQIKPDMVSEFLMVRYHLTRGKNQSKVVEQTMLQVLDELIPALQRNSGSLDVAIEAHLRNVGLTAPWQYVKILVDEWTTFETWLIKEMTAIPVDKPLRIQKTAQNVSKVAAYQLAINWWVSQSKGQTERLTGVTEDKITSLADTFMNTDKVDWSIVATIFSTAPFVPSTELDDDTKQWLQALENIS